MQTVLDKIEGRASDNEGFARVDDIVETFNAPAISEKGGHVKGFSCSLTTGRRANLGSGEPLEDYLNIEYDQESGNSHSVPAKAFAKAIERAAADASRGKESVQIVDIGNMTSSSAESCRLLTIAPFEFRKGRRQEPKLKISFQYL